MRGRIFIFLSALALVSLLTPGDLCLAKYSSSEILVLPWGGDDNQLFITEPIYDQDSLPRDSVIIVPADGPDLAVVDRNDDIVFGSTSSATIQAFDKTGKQILILFYTSPYMDIADSSGEFSTQSGTDDFSVDPEIGAPFKCSGLANIYLDSLSRIYIESSSDQDFIAIVGLDGILLDKINPSDYNLFINLQDMTYNSNDILTFVDDLYYDMYTYRNGTLFQGGLAGWLARDNYYYSAVIDTENHTIEFSLLGNPDNPEFADAFKMESRPFKPKADFCSVVGVSDNMLIFVSSNTYKEDAGQLIQIYSAKLDLIDQFKLKRNSPNKLQFYAPLPYFRPDGVIFEFQSRDDGMHIIKWADDK